MKKSTIGGNKRKLANALAMIGLIIVFIAYMFPFLMVVINSLKEKRDIMILSRLVDTFISRISLTMLPVPNPHNTVCVLSWEEARH